MGNCCCLEEDPVEQKQDAQKQKKNPYYDNSVENLDGKNPNHDQVEVQMSIKNQEQKAQSNQQVGSEYTDKKIHQLKQISLKINQLYDISFRQRSVDQNSEYFVQERVEFKGLCQNYSIRKDDVKDQLKVICNAYRQVRGDGNSFYTSFGIQFLEILLIQYSDDQYNKFIQWIFNIKLPFKIYYQEFSIDDIEMESQLRDEFLYRLESIRCLDRLERFDILCEQYKASKQTNKKIDGCFYGIATIFFRNLSKYAIEQSEMKKLFVEKKNLLDWEQKCDNQEIVMTALAHLLKIHIKFLLFEQQEFKVMDYCPENQYQIMLLTMLGHYNIGYKYQGQNDEVDYPKEKNDIIQPSSNNKQYELDIIRQLINKLYDQSYPKRYVEQSFAFFIGQKENFQGLCQNYSIRGSDIKEKLKYICNSYRQVRGQGNSFYISFGFQFFEILLVQYSDEQYNKFIQLIKNIQIPFKIHYQQINYIEEGQYFRNEFINRLDMIRQLNKLERFDELYKQYSAYKQKVQDLDGCFYGMAIIFLRNLSNYAMDQQSMKEFQFDNLNLLLWESEINEIVIQALALLLEIHVQLVIFDQQEFQLQEYCSENQYQIILLTQKGHYNIGYKESLPISLDQISEVNTLNIKAMPLLVYQEEGFVKNIISPSPQPKFPFLKNNYLERELINKLYDLSCRKRYVEQRFAYFVREKENFQELCKNYSIRGSNAKTKLKQICNSYRQARGDGNCFYTSFGIQFLEILVVQYSDEQYNQFIQWIQNLKLPFKINYQDFQIDDLELEQKFRDEFLSRLDTIRQLNKQERFDQLFEQFRAYQYIDQELDGCFYGIATIFFRNLSNLAVEQSEMKEFLFDRLNLLLWETECNNNEIVIQALAQLLKIHIKLVFFEQQEFKVQDYSPENQYKIILLIKPGHYNIGYLEQDQEAF